MLTYDEQKDADRKLEKEKVYPAKDNKELLHDAQNIKENVVGLARNIRDSSTDKAHVAADYMRDRMDDLKHSGTDTLGKIESSIKAKPAQSVAIAFTAGLLASFLLGRRSS
jgi:ElaB/YqjD/DUF883 family membrane-anchored ribosome-binding protein